MSENGTRASRRRFLKSLAATTAAAMAGPAVALAANDAKGTKAKPSNDAARAGKTAPPPELVKGIDEQKAYLARTVETIRTHALPTNSEQAFVFAPLAQDTKEGGR